MSLPGGSEQSAGNLAPQLGAGDPLDVREGIVANCPYMCQALGFLATDLAISVRLASASVRLASIECLLGHRLGGEVETHQCIWFSRPNIWQKKAQGLAHQIVVTFMTIFMTNNVT